MPSHSHKAGTRTDPVRPLGAPARLAIWLIVALVAGPAALAAFKVSGLPGAAAASTWLSLEHLPHEVRSRTNHLLFAPLGALVVVVIRLTLGIRVLGPFRSVLLAIAFEMTGPVVGIAFFALVVGVIVTVRPIFKALRLPYFGRSAAMLSSVAIVIVMAMLIGTALGLRDVERVVYFPIVVLTLTGDAFANALRREGRKAALWRAGTTLAVALLITALASIRVLHETLVRFPELLLGTLGAVILVCEFLDLRLLQHLNPPPARQKRRTKSRARAAVTPAKGPERSDVVLVCAGPGSGT